MHWVAWSSIILKHLKTLRKAVFACGKLAQIEHEENLLSCQREINFGNSFIGDFFAGFHCWRTMAINSEQKTAERSGNCFM